jgi:site-specific DNA-cytosine methylase
MIMGENVEGMIRWGEVRNGRFARGSRGREFRRWARALRGLGYELGWNVLSACDFGAPTSRSRLFFAARLDGRPPVWPKPTHGGRGDPPWPSARGCLDLDEPVPPPTWRYPKIADKIAVWWARAATSLFDEPNGLEGAIFTYKFRIDFQSWSRPMPTILANPSMFLCLHRRGKVYGLRGLTLDELKRAQGFPEDFTLDAATADGRPVTVRAKYAVIGNSVSPPPAEALIRANIDALG